MSLWAITAAFVTLASGAMVLEHRCGAPPVMIVLGALSGVFVSASLFVGNMRTVGKLATFAALGVSFILLQTSLATLACVPSEVPWLSLAGLSAVLAMLPTVALRNWCIGTASPNPGDTPRKILSLLMFGAAFAVATLLAGSHKLSRAAVEVAFGILFTAVFDYVIKGYSAELIAAERPSDRANSTDRPTLDALRFDIGLEILGVMLAAITALAAIVVSGHPIDEGLARSDWTTPLTSFIVAAVLGTVGIRLRSNISGDTRLRPVRAVGKLLCVAACLVWGGTSISVAVYSAREMPLLAVLVAAASAVLFGILTAESLFRNVWAIQRLSAPAIDLVVATAAALACTATGFWVLTAGVWGVFSAVSSLTLVAAGVTAALILTSVCGFCVTLAPREVHLTNNRPIDGVLQDAFLYSFLFFFAAWMPLALYRYDRPTGWEWFGWAAFLSPAAVAFLWFVEMDFQHLEYERALPLADVQRRCFPRMIDASINNRRIHSLQSHIRCQVLLAFGLSIIMTIGGLLADVLKGTSVQRDLRLLRELTTSHFIPVVRAVLGRDPPRRSRASTSASIPSSTRPRSSTSPPASSSRATRASWCSARRASARATSPKPSRTKPVAAAMRSSS